MTSGPLADWALASRVGDLLAGYQTPTVTRDEVAALRADITDVVGRADRVARRVTGLGADLPPADVHVVGRRAWIRNNLATLADLTDPVAERLVRTSGMARTMTRRGLGLQLGVVFGFLSTKVLGQYEALLPGGQTPGRLTIVGPNLVVLEREMLPESEVDAAELRMGLCLHEVAHRLQFEAVPWLRPELRSIVDAYVADARVDPDRLREAAAAAGEVLRNPARVLDDPRALLDTVLTPGQRELLDRAQNLMSLLEGHGNVVMEWGAEIVDAEEGVGLDPARVRTVLNRRREKAGDQALRKALGLAMKAEQYRVGERFILDVAERHGRSTFDRVWEDPSHVPDGDELTDPDAWVARVTTGG